MVGVLRESSIRVGVAPHPPLPNQMNSRVIVGNKQSRLATFRERVRLSHTTTRRKMLGGPFSRTGNRFKKSENNCLQKFIFKV